MFPLASGLLTHGRSRDFPCTPLDHYLTLGQQVVFQSLELQEVPISPQRLSSSSFASKLIIRGPRLSPQVKLTPEPAKCNTPIQMLFVFPVHNLHDNQPGRPITSMDPIRWIHDQVTPWLARNLTLAHSWEVPL